MENGIEGLMLKNGLTPKDIHRIKKFSRRSGNSIQVEITNLGNSLFRLILVFLLLILTLCSAIYFSSDNNHTSLIISFLIAVSIICFFSAPRLRYKSFLFIKKTKENNDKEYNRDPHPYHQRK